MNLVPHPKWPSLMILGPRVRPGMSRVMRQSDVERVLVAIVKMTFTSDDAALNPSHPQLPVFMKDDPFDQQAQKPMRYEHDMASYKPKADVIVLGAPAPPVALPANTAWTERVIIDNQVMANSFSSMSEPRFTFGWQDRTAGQRLGYAGRCGSPDFDPNTMQMPVDFNNLFFNGGGYLGGSEPVFDHPAPGGLVKVESTYNTSTTIRKLYLPSVPPRATVTYKQSGFANTTSIPVSMKIDTIVFDKATGQFYVVWRGVWPFDSIATDRYVAFSLS